MDTIDYVNEDFVIKFQVKAKNSAHLALTIDGDENNDMFEIVISSSKSVIRTLKEGTDEVE